jgi:hypothetical protein
MPTLCLKPLLPQHKDTGRAELICTHRDPRLYCRFLLCRPAQVRTGSTPSGAAFVGSGAAANMPGYEPTSRETQIEGIHPWPGGNADLDAFLWSGSTPGASIACFPPGRSVQPATAGQCHRATSPRWFSDPGQNPDHNDHPLSLRFPRPMSAEVKVSLRD